MTVSASGAFGLPAQALPGIRNDWRRIGADPAQLLAHRDAQKPRIVGDPVPDRTPRTYFEPDPNMSDGQRRQRLHELHQAGLTDLDVSRCDRESLDGLEGVVLEQAREAAAHSGQLFRKVTQDTTGRDVITFAGDPRAWMQDFKDPGRSIKFNNHAGQHRVAAHWESDAPADFSKRAG